MKIKLSSDTIKTIRIFSNLTNASVKDSFEKEGTLYFIVQEGELGKAIGKKGINVKRIANTFKKPIKIVEFNQKITKFITNLLYPVKAEIIIENNLVTLTPTDHKTRGIIIGRNAKNLKSLQSIVKRYFEIEKISVNG